MFRHAAFCWVALGLTQASQACAQIDAAAYVTVRAGVLPIVISVPHGGDKLLPGVATRQDQGQKFFVTTRDQRTAELAELLSAHLSRLLGGAPFLVIARFDRRHIDANRAAVDAYTRPGDGGPKLVYDAYHQAITDAATAIKVKWGRGVVIDLHGQSRFPDQMIRGTHNGKSVTSLLARFGAEAVTGPRSIFAVLAAKGYKIAPSGAAGDTVERYFSGGHIIHAHGSADGGDIDAIQVEVGSRYREPERLEQTARDLADAIAAFAKSYLPERTTK